MKTHKAITDRLRRQITDFLFREMPAAKRRELEEHLESCTVCKREAESQRILAAQLGFEDPSQAPAKRTAAVTQPWQGWRAGRAEMVHTVPGGPEGFEPTAHPGITVKRLFVDTPNDRVTMVIRMQAGSSYPAHRHAGAEECLVLEGDLKAGPVTMHSGDYQRAEAGSLHPVQSTDSGCVLFIVSSLRDEITD
jgi:quercetin dioxygenase-like cupin family protein